VTADSGNQEFHKYLAMITKCDLGELKGSVEGVWRQSISVRFGKEHPFQKGSQSRSNTSQSSSSSTVSSSTISKWRIIQLDYQPSTLIEICSLFHARFLDPRLMSIILNPAAAAAAAAVQEAGQSGNNPTPSEIAPDPTNQSHITGDRFENRMAQSVNAPPFSSSHLRNKVVKDPNEPKINLVQGSAGTGKTYSIAETVYGHFVCKDISVASPVVLFAKTNAAANEMVLKIVSIFQKNLGYTTEKMQSILIRFGDGKGEGEGEGEGEGKEKEENEMGAEVLKHYDINLQAAQKMLSEYPQNEHNPTGKRQYLNQAKHFLIQNKMIYITTAHSMNNRFFSNYINQKNLRRRCRFAYCDEGTLLTEALLLSTLQYNTTSLSIVGDQKQMCGFANDYLNIAYQQSTMERMIAADYPCDKLTVEYRMVAGSFFPSLFFLYVLYFLFPFSFANFFFFFFE
jgi:hypothetical protein